MTTINWHCVYNSELIFAACISKLLGIIHNAEMNIVLKAPKTCEMAETLSSTIYGKLAVIGWNPGWTGRKYNLQAFLHFSLSVCTCAFVLRKPDGLSGCEGTPTTGLQNVLLRWTDQGTGYGSFGNCSGSHGEDTTEDRVRRLEWMGTVWGKNLVMCSCVCTYLSSILI